MSVVGFDFGNQSGVVAVARKGGIDVVLNEESKCETPAIVCFVDKQIFLGNLGAATSMMNPMNAISQIKRLIGRLYSDPELQRDLKSLPFLVTEGPDGFPLIHARYLGETRSYTPTQILGMVFSNLKSIAKKVLNAGVVDCSIGIPVYFTNLQRRAVLDAATFARLRPLRLIHETTATALYYGNYKTDLPENDPINVALVDVGHASMQVCIAALKKGQVKILACSFDRSLGGRDFDEALFQHFAAKFKEQYGIDVFGNARACVRLRAACEKLKKVLSDKLVGSLNIECLMDETDVRGFIRRDEFEEISIPILERVKKPLEKAVTDARLSVGDIFAVELVGSGSRVPAVFRILTEFFGREPRRTMHASECVAKGCALQAAILSPTFKVHEFQVHDFQPFSIALTWKSEPDSNNASSDNLKSIVAFPKGYPIPSVKAMTFNRSRTFTFNFQYADMSELQAPEKISTYTIGPFRSAKESHAKVKVKVRLNLHGVISIESAILCDEDVKVPIKEETQMDTNESFSAFPLITETPVGYASSPPYPEHDEELAMALQASLHSLNIPQSDPVSGLDASSSSSSNPIASSSGTVNNPAQDDGTPIHYPTIDPTPLDLSAPVLGVSASSTKPDDVKDEASSMCVICLDAPVEGACIPCGHMAGCMSCLNEIKAKNWGCPVCRASINQVLRIYSV